jgi:hypothetical protein
VKRLSQVEQEGCRLLGLCYNCDDKYTRGHNRVYKRLFYIDSVELDDIGDTATTVEAAREAPVFSLRVVTGVPICNMVQLKVELGATFVVALLDTGSTHNFISEAAAQSSGLPIQPCPRLMMTVANCEKFSRPGVLRQAPVTIDGQEFRVDLFVMPLAGFDVVLGTVWMATLRPIIWDFTARTMTFQQGGHAVC